MELETVVRPVVEGQGLELVDVTFRREAGRRVLRVIIDRDGGIDLDTIAQTSERISRRLDVEGYRPGPYTLEVSSPGLERPLKTSQDFARQVGNKVKVRTHQPVDGARKHLGTLLAATEEALTIDTDGGERIVPLDVIASARSVFEWGNR